MKIIAYTARFGETDALRPPVLVDARVRYICFGDQPTNVPPYEWVELPSESDPRLAARRLKVLADHPILAEAKITVWHDASYQLTSSPRWMMRDVPPSADLVAMHHPRRFTIEQEAVAIARYGYLPIETAQEYVAAYRAEGFTADVLTASGLLARRLSAKVTAFNEFWWTEVRRWNGRDQSSTDYAAWKAGATVHHVPGTIKANPYAGWRVRPMAVPA